MSIEPRPYRGEKPTVPDDPKYVKLLAPVRRVQIWLDESPNGRKLKAVILSWLTRKVIK